MVVLVVYGLGFACLLVLIRGVICLTSLVYCVGDCWFCFVTGCCGLLGSVAI